MNHGAAGTRVFRRGAASKVRAVLSLLVVGFLLVPMAAAGPGGLSGGRESSEDSEITEATRAARQAVQDAGATANAFGKSIRQQTADEVESVYVQKRALESEAWRHAQYALDAQAPSVEPLPVDADQTFASVADAVQALAPEPVDSVPPPRLLRGESQKPGQTGDMEGAEPNGSDGQAWEDAEDSVQRAVSPVPVVDSFALLKRNQGCRSGAVDCAAAADDAAGPTPMAGSDLAHDEVALSDDALAALALTGGMSLLALLLWFWRSTVAAFAWRLWLTIGLRVRNKQPEDHPVRAAILAHVIQHPGATPRELAQAAGVGYNRVSYHLSMLERIQLLRLRRRGTAKHYFASGAPRVHDEDLQTRALVTTGSPGGRLVRHLREHAGESLSTIARAFGYSPGHTHYHLSRLADAGLVRRVRSGRSIRHYLTPAGHAWSQRAFPHWVNEASATDAGASTAANSSDSGVAA